MHYNVVNSQYTTFFCVRGRKPAKTIKTLEECQEHP